MISDAITASGAKTMKDMGKVMGALEPLSEAAPTSER